MAQPAQTKFTAIAFGILTAGLWISSGCATPEVLIPGPTPLRPETHMHLASISRPANVLGITLEKTPTGETRMTHTRAVPLGATATIAFGESSEAPVIPLQTGTTRGKALLATGLSVSTVSVTNADKLRYTPIGPPLTRTRVTDVMSHHNAYLAVLHSLRLGKVNMYNLPVGILDDERGLTSFSWARAQEVDILLGMDFFQSFSFVTFDFEKRQMTLAKGLHNEPSPETVEARIPFSYQAGRPVIDIFIQGKGPFPAILAMEQDLSLWIPDHLATMLRKPKPTPSEENDRPYLPTAPLDVLMEAAAFPGMDAVVSRDTKKNDLSFAVIGYRAFAGRRVTLDFESKAFIIEKK